MSGPSTRACWGCRVAEDLSVPADITCSACGLALCGACAGPRTSCPRCLMPWTASLEQVQALRAHAEAVRATWPRRVHPETTRTLEAALRVGVPIEALRKVRRRVEERIRLANLEALAAREAGG